MIGQEPVSNRQQPLCIPQLWLHVMSKTLAIYAIMVYVFGTRLSDDKLDYFRRLKSSPIFQILWYNDYIHDRW